MTNLTCNCCPRKCETERISSVGFCGMKNEMIIAKAYLHKWEEPCLCGKNGAGAVFFSGCNLKCVYCQNYKISKSNFGNVFSVSQLADTFLKLEDMGASNIDLITPTHFVFEIIKALDLVKNKLSIPIVYNCGGYELSDTIRLLNGYIDIYMPDIKYFSDEYAIKYSSAPNYFSYASQAVTQMINQTGELVYNDDGVLLRGTIIRHLAIPGLRKDSIKIIEWIANNLPIDKFLISIMSQFTPTPNLSDEYPEINRHITKMEYNSIVNRASELFLNGFCQNKSSADSVYIPDFDV